MGQLTSTDLRQPQGDISDDWFPLLDSAGIDTLLTAYLADGYERIPATIVSESEQNRAARAWAMSRANRNVLSRLTNGPANFKLENEGQQSIIAEQIKTVRAQAERYEAEFAGIVDVPGSNDTADEVGQGAARNVIIW